MDEKEQKMISVVEMDTVVKLDKIEEGTEIEIGTGLEDFNNKLEELMFKHKVREVVAKLIDKKKLPMTKDEVIEALVNR